ncbi:MAG: caspase family protein, partial [Methanothrix sp.]
MQTILSEGRALIMGVGADLPNTVDDARGLVDILKDPARCAYRPDQVDLLTSEAAGRSGILAGLDRLAKRADEKSTVVIYFSGHGYHVKSSIGEAYYLMPFGYNIEQLKDTAISGPEFAEKLKAIKAQKLLLLLDCCHAGGLTDLKAPGLQFAKAPLPPEAQSLFAKGRGRVVIASSQANELSFAGKPYSAFTLALINALCGAGASRKDGYVRVIDLALH